MKKLLLIIFFSNLTYFLFGETYDFTGTITVNNSEEIYYYKIFFEVNDTMVKGFSITDLNGDNETKVNLIGTFNKKKKCVRIEEIDIVYTKSKVDISQFCFVKSNLYLKKVLGKTILQGHYYGRYLNDEVCSEGDIYLIGTDELYKGLSKHLNLVKKLSSDTVTSELIKQFTNEDVKNIESIKNASSTDAFSYKWDSDTIRLIVWDDGKNDGDKVCIKQDGIIKYKEILLTSEKLELFLLLQSPETHIEVIALNEGSTPPNTGKVTLKDIEKEYLIITNVEIGKSFKIKVLRN